MKRFQKIMVLCLAALMVLSLAACGNKATSKKTDSEKEASQIVRSAPCVLVVRADIELSIGFDENGNALAVASSDAADSTAATVSAASNVAGMSAEEAIKVVLKNMAENATFAEHQYVTILQQHDTIVPSEDFLGNVAAAAEEVMEEMPVIVISAADMDNDGYFTAEIAEKILQAYLGDSATIIASSTMIDGCYIISCEENNTINDYSVSAYSGAIALYSDLVELPTTEDDLVPEDEQFTADDNATENVDADVNTEDDTAEDVVIEN